MEKLAKKIRELRKQSNYNQTQLARFIGMTPSTISDWENERSEPNVIQLIRLADIFNCSIDYLCERESEDGVIKIISQSEKSEIQTLFDKLDRFEKERVLGYVRALVAMKDTGAGNQAN